jgi:hypothetical protein
MARARMPAHEHVEGRGSSVPGRRVMYPSRSRDGRGCSGTSRGCGRYLRCRG